MKMGRGLGRERGRERDYNCRMTVTTRIPRENTAAKEVTCADLSLSHEGSGPPDVRRERKKESEKNERRRGLSGCVPSLASAE